MDGTEQTRDDLDGLSHHDIRDRLRRIEAMCRPYCNPACTTSTHELAGKVIRVIEEGGERGGN